MDFQYPQGLCLEEHIGTELVPFVKKFRYFTNDKDHNQNGPQGVGRNENEFRLFSSTMDVTQKGDHLSSFQVSHLKVLIAFF